MALEHRAHRRVGKTGRQSTVSGDTAVLLRGLLLGAVRREQLIPLGKARKTLRRECRLSWVGPETGVAFQAEAQRPERARRLWETRLHPLAWGGGGMVGTEVPSPELGPPSHLPGVSSTARARSCPLPLVTRLSLAACPQPFGRHQDDCE